VVVCSIRDLPARLDTLQPTVAGESAEDLASLLRYEPLADIEAISLRRMKRRG
jgi:hypothetical protein